MRNKIINWFFNRFRTEIEDRFISDVFGDIPTKQNEHAMRFLLSGGKEFDRWLRLSAYSFQKKLQQPLGDNGKIFTAGLIFIKTIDTMISRLERGDKVNAEEASDIIPPPDLNQSMRGVDEFFENRPKVD